MVGQRGRPEQLARRNERAVGPRFRRPLLIAGAQLSPGIKPTLPVPHLRGHRVQVGRGDAVCCQAPAVGP